MRNTVPNTLREALERQGWFFIECRDLATPTRFCLYDPFSTKLYPYDGVVVVNTETSELTVYATPTKGHHKTALPPQAHEPSVVKLKPGTAGRALTIAVLKELRALEGVHLVSGLNTLA